MAHEEDERIQHLLHQYAVKVKQLEAFADAKAKENEKLIDRIYRNHNLLKGKSNG